MDPQSQKQHIARKSKKKLEIYRFGLDFARFSFVPGFEGIGFDALMSGLSANSSQKMDQEFLGERFTIQLTQDSNKMKAVILQYEGHAVFHIEKCRDMGANKHMSYLFSFYSSFFYIPEMGELLERFIKRYKKHILVSRVDLSFDHNYSVFALNQNYRTKTIKYEQRGQGKNMQTFYLGARKYNPKHFIRVYDKKLDSSKKGKYLLFGHYLGKETVTRVELQANVLSCRNFGIETSHILDLHNKRESKEAFGTFLFQVFRSTCCNKSGTDFPDIHKKNYENLLVPLRTHQTNGILDEIPYARVMLGYARTLHKQGFDVLSYLRPRLDADQPSREPS